MTRHAVVLLSGGLDSATALAIAKSEGFACRAITFDYGQRHRVELEAARRVAASIGVVEHVVFAMDFRQIGGSALTAGIAVPKDRAADQMTDIPVTYVPCRNTVFVSIAAGLAEARGDRDLYIGVNALDYSGYPDCRPEFVRAMEEAIAQGTKCGVSGDRIRVHAPLVRLTKAQIIQRGRSLGIDYAVTHSCYDPDTEGLACGRCDSCVLRHRGFLEAGGPDPTRYAGSAHRR
jgi:7-cyano-7-deazaguanine synthase